MAEAPLAVGEPGTAGDPAADAAFVASEYEAADPEAVDVPPEKVDPRRDAFLIGLGWLGTGLALEVAKLPFQLHLKNRLGVSAEELATFFLIVNIPIYIKPLAGVLTDAVPLFGTRRRSYLIGSLLLGGLFWVLVGLAPLHMLTLMCVYFTLNICMTMTSTVLGGLMVEVGKRDHSTGRLSAQRHGITRGLNCITGTLSGYLASLPFLITGVIAGALHMALAPLYWKQLREPSNVRPRHEVLREVGRQFRALFASRTLWSAAGLVVLVVAAPGFETPLLYHQTNTLGFSPQFIGNLSTVLGFSALLGAWLYGTLCKRLNLRQLLAASIVFHGVMTLWYLAYRDPLSAIIITALEAITMVLALLPLYDLAARATPRGSEAIGYSLMMSVWNFTKNGSDWVGSWLYSHWGLTFQQLVWVNAGTTLLVLIAVPFLPAALMNRRDGDPEAVAAAPEPLTPE